MAVKQAVTGLQCLRGIHGIIPHSKAGVDYT